MAEAIGHADLTDVNALLTHLERDGVVRRDVRSDLSDLWRAPATNRRSDERGRRFGAGALHAWWTAWLRRA